MHIFAIPEIFVVRHK